MTNLHKWAFFYFSPEENTVINRNKSGNCEFITVGFDPSAKETNQIIEVALKLKEEGIQSLELCGGFGPTWVAKITESFNFEIPVGGVMYGPEFRKQLLETMR